MLAAGLASAFLLVRAFFVGRVGRSCPGAGAGRVAHPAFRHRGVAFPAARLGGTGVQFLGSHPAQLCAREEGRTAPSGNWTPLGNWRGRRCAQSESRYRRLVENINDAIVVNDVEGRVVFANRRFREWFGYKRGTPRRDARRLRGPGVAAAGARPARPPGARRDRARPLRVRRHSPDGTRIWIEALDHGGGRGRRKSSGPRPRCAT